MEKEQIDQPTSSSPCTRSNSNFSPQMVQHFACTLPNDNLGNLEARQTDDDDDGHSKADETITTRCQSLSEEKMEVSSAISTSSSVASKSKKIKLNKPTIKKQFKSTRDETNSPSTSKSYKTKRFSCEKCESAFWTKSHVILHTKTVHDRITRYECYFCCKRYFRLGTLFDHIIRRHTKEQPFTCYICGSKFKHSSSLNVHTKTVHEGIQPLKSLKCTFKNCDYRCARQRDIIVHLRSHTGESPFKCNVCRSRFKQRTHLNRHIKTVHLVIKPLKCNFKDCDKRFAMQSHLNDHMRIHTNECPFKCDICESKFKQRTHLNRHIKQVHQGIKRLNWKCTYGTCVYRFNKKTDLTEHMKIHTESLPLFQ